MHTMLGCMQCCPSVSDYEKVISHYIQYDNYRGALAVLEKQVCN